jgi:diaminopimelate decarboxylase
MDFHHRESRILPRAARDVQRCAGQTPTANLVPTTVAAGCAMPEGARMGRGESLLSLFPPGSDVDGEGMLRVGGCRADALAETYGTPVLVVAEDALRARAREYVDELAARWPRSRVVFASKAFPCTAVQRVMVEEGLGLDVAGGGEIVTALAAGVDPALLVHHGNAKGDEEIAMAVEHGIGLVVVDNADDVDRLEAAVPAGRTQDVLVRVIPGVTAETHAHVLTGHAGSKFGLEPRAAAELIRRIERSRRLTMRGLHVHVGSQILDVEPFAASVAPIAALGEFPVYDLGGGLGARYTYTDEPPSVAAYLDALMGAAREHLPAEAEVILEPGRSMVASAAATLYRVVTVKRGAITFVAVDGGMGDNLEVALFDQRFEAGIAGRLETTDGEVVIVVGRHCESGDVLVDGVALDAPRVGDLVAVPATGAYCFTMANNYNGTRRIPVIFAAGGGARLVVRRESWADLLARDVV